AVAGTGRDRGRWGGGRGGGRGGDDRRSDRRSGRSDDDRTDPGGGTVTPAARSLGQPAFAREPTRSAGCVRGPAGRGECVVRTRRGRVALGRTRGECCAGRLRNDRDGCRRDLETVEGGVLVQLRQSRPHSTGSR